MKQLIMAIVCTGMLCTAAQALADNSTSSDTSSHQMMKDCMAKHAAKNDGTSKADMKKACNDEMTTQSSSSSTPKATDDPTTDKNIGNAKSTNK